MLGGAGAMPPALRACYTECERAVLYIVAAEVKRCGICDLSVGEIAARAGVCVRTVQNAVAEGMRQGHLDREVREVRGRKNNTNLLRIKSQEWLAWIKRGPIGIGCKVWSATENIYKKTRGTGPESRVTLRDSGCGPRVARILRVSG
jgi:hypothetical protein